MKFEDGNLLQHLKEAMIEKAERRISLKVLQGNFF